VLRPCALMLRRAQVEQWQVKRRVSS
jgi:hypothetical protein